MGVSKLIVASARLPVSLHKAGERWEAQASPGGLATALRAVAEKRPFTWIGWPGTHLAPEERPAVAEILAEQSHGVPVFINEEELGGFYEEFSNRVLWPLFHNLPTPVKFDHAAWSLYQKINRRFADVICEQASPGDTVWVHDYQLALVPKLLRERGVDCAVGFFLHIPFPASETYRALPVRQSILRGMLGADLLGFHSYEYVSHFRSSALRILGLESDPEGVLLPTHRAHLGVLPIGIEPSEVEQLSETDEAAAQYAELSESLRGRKVILGVDRLDYTKGLPQKFSAFEELLRKRPDLRDQVVLIQVASPSRMGVVEYQALKREMDELAGRIAGTYSTLGGSPLMYINQNVSRARLTALYRLADVALITPVRDGMNLVSLEYIAARGETPGTLILSEFTGSATCLPGAVLVNPHNPSQIASALATALSQQPSAESWEHMRDFVLHNTSSRWAERFLARLESAYHDAAGRIRRLRIDDGDVIERLSQSERPLILLDYDGTLQPHVRLPSQAAPSARVKRVLAELAGAGLTYVISGRTSDVLDDWLGDLDIGLVCEHGLAVRHPGGPWSEPPTLDLGALEEIVAPIFKDFTERTPGSRVESKAASVAWHYRGADPKLGAWRAKELRAVLESSLSGQPYVVLGGSRVIEVRHVEVSKGHATTALLDRYPNSDFVFCAGNDRTDEDMFEALRRSGRGPAVICHVGSVHAAAEFFVESPRELLAQLESMIATWRA